MKRYFIKALLIFFSGICFAAADYRAAFLKGNIQEKTAAVREASGNEGIWLSAAALKFALENKQYLGKDRDLDSLVVASILSIPDNFFDDSSNPDTAIFLNDFSNIFTLFADSSTVQIALLQKIIQIKDKINTKDFTKILNNYIKTLSPSSDSGLVKNVFNALEVIGDRESFVILYNHWNNKRYSAFFADIEKTLISLSGISSGEIIQIIHSKDINQLCKVFALAQKNTGISKNILCEIAENALSESILLVDSSSKLTQAVKDLQTQCLEILVQNKCTRASAIAIDYLRFSKKMFDNNVISEEIFASVISSMTDISPIDSVSPLCSLLDEFNNRKEKNEKVPDAIVRAVINTLGAIGNKSAFDYLLAVTYLSYPEDVLAAAREALAGLRWQ